MTESDKVESRGVVIPYVGIERIIEFLTAMRKHSAKEKALSEIATLLGWKKGNLNNITPALGILGLGEVKKGTLILTMEGLAFSDACASKDYEKAKQIIKKNIDNSEAMKFTKSLLETRSSISGSEIGRALAERFKKGWKDMATFRYFGNSCASILAFAGIGYYYDGVLSTKPPTIKLTSTLYPPSIGFNPLLNILKAMHGFERATLSDIAKKLQVNDAGLYTDLTVCTILKLVEKETANTYSLTNPARQLIDPTISDEKKSEIFKGCLLNSPYADIIQKLAESEKEMTYDEIGDVLAFSLKRDWSADSKKIFAKKFVTWLNNAGLAEKVKPGIYKIKTDTLEQIQSAKTISEGVEPKKTIDTNVIYEIGRAVGNLESIILESDKTSFFNDRVVFLKELLDKHEDLKLTLDMLGKNFEIAVNSNNPSIYKSNIDFIREKIKEKIATGAQ